LDRAGTAGAGAAETSPEPPGLAPLREPGQPAPSSAPSPGSCRPESRSAASESLPSGRRSGSPGQRTRRELSQAAGSSALLRRVPSPRTSPWHPSPPLRHCGDHRREPV